MSPDMPLHVHILEKPEEPFQTVLLSSLQPDVQVTWGDPTQTRSPADFAVLVDVTYTKIPRAGHLYDSRRDAFYVMDIFIAFSTFVILVEIFAVRTNVHIENRRLETRNVIHGNHCLFCRCHAAYRGTVFIAA